MIGKIVQPALAEAIRMVMRRLPDKNADREQVLMEADNYLRNRQPPETLGSAWHQVGLLVRMSPRCWGVKRKKSYWPLVLEHLQRDEAVKLYVDHQFPAEITERQFGELRRHLIEVLEVVPTVADNLMQRFHVRPSSRRSLTEQGRKGNDRYPSFVRHPYSL